MCDGTTEEVFAQLRAEHVENPATLCVGPLVELIPGMIVLPVGNRPLFILVVKNALAVIVNVVQQGIVPVFVAIIDSFFF